MEALSQAEDDGRARGRKRPMRRVVVLAARVPRLADRRGMRWLLGGRVMPGGPLALLTLRGRRSGQLYTTPVEVLVEDDERSEIVVTPMRGRRSDWYRNVLAGGLIGVRFRGHSFEPRWRELAETEAREALAVYVHEHRLFGRMVVWGMARGSRNKADRLGAAAKAVPLLALAIDETEGSPGR